MPSSGCLKYWYFFIPSFAMPVSDFVMRYVLASSSWHLRASVGVLGGSVPGRAGGLAEATDMFRREPPTAGCKNEIRIFDLLVSLHSELPITGYKLEQGSSSERQQKFPVLLAT